MLKTVSRIAWQYLKAGLFVTLTFPDEVLPMDAYRRNQARYVFFRSLEAYLGRNVSALWRIEWPARKSGKFLGSCCPHFHLIIFSVPFIPYGKVRSWWRQAIGYGDGPLDTKVQSLSDKRHHAVYVAKYAAKPPELYLDSLSKINIDGRHWGIHRRPEVPWCETVTYDGLNDQQIERLKQVGYDNFRWYGEYAELGFSAFGILGEKLRQEIERICLDIGEDA